ncbi:MAG: 4Fe-4S binding protein [Armatimonadota bacterium]
MNKPSVWRRSKRNARRDGSSRQPVRSATPSVWRPRPIVRTRTTPEAAAKKRKKRYYTVQIDETWCKDCGICAAFCPTGALEDGGHGEPLIADMDLCNGCQLCVVRCPDFAVVVVEDSRGPSEEEGE